MTDLELGELKARVEAAESSAKKHHSLTLAIVPIVALICGGAVGYTWTTSTATDTKIESRETKSEEARKDFRNRHRQAAKGRNAIQQNVDAARVESAQGDAAIYGKLGEIQQGQMEILLELRRRP